MSAAIAQLAQFMARHPRLLVLTGAGCSTESGIPDYRDAAGRWKRPEPMRYQRFIAEPLARQRYWARSLIGWRRMADAQPGAAHRALAQLEAAGYVRMLVTQNVDGLHGAAGSRRVIDLHGRIDTVCCLACHARLPRERMQHELLRLNPGWERMEAHTAPDGDAYLDGVDFAAFAVPPCPACGGVLKPDVVFFGENVPRERVGAALAALAQADALLVAGSSLMVYSGYRFARAALDAGQPMAAVNLGHTRADALLALKLEQPVGAALTALAAALREGEPRQPER